jgi:hypothetical protein
LENYSRRPRPKLADIVSSGTLTGAAYEIAEKHRATEIQIAKLPRNASAPTHQEAEAALEAQANAAAEEASPS